MNVSLLLASAPTPTILGAEERAAFFANPNVAVAGHIPRPGRIGIFPLTPGQQQHLWRERWVDDMQPAPLLGDVLMFQTVDGLSPWRVVRVVPGCIVLEPLKVVAS